MLPLRGQGARCGEGTDARFLEDLVQVGEHRVSRVIFYAFPLRVALAILLFFGLYFGLFLGLLIHQDTGWVLRKCVGDAQQVGKIRGGYKCMGEAQRADMSQWHHRTSACISSGVNSM